MNFRARVQVLNRIVIPRGIIETEEIAKGDWVEVEVKKLKTG